MSKAKVTEGFLMPLAAGTMAGVLANQFPQNLKHSKHRDKAAKKLKKIEPNFAKSDDFNERAARQAFDLVMKMDTETARVFTEMVVGDVVDETIEKNLKMLQSRLNEVVEKRLDGLKTAVIRASIKDAEGALPFAKALSEISKAKTPYDYGYRFQESDFNRDPGTGRFKMKVKRKQSAPLSDRHAEAVVGTSNPKNLKGKNLAQFQEEYRQLAAYLDAVNSSVGAGNAQTILHLQDKKTGERYVEVHTSTKPPKSLLADPNTRLLGAESRPTGLTVGGAAFSLTNALGRPIDYTTGRRIDTAAERFDDFATDWTAPGDVQNRNARTYNRIEAGSKYLGQVAPAGSKLQMATTFGQFVGSHGPQAEAVIGPTARKTAYRYRGTEKVPDKDLVGDYAAAIGRAKMESAYVPGKDGTPKAPAQQAYQRISAERRDPTWEEREGGRRAVIGYLRNRLPNPQLSALQLESGNTPPSEGVIINKNGQIVTQAVGYADDHYLPFDLKNLKSLKGGEYIRTRSYGGPTSEDVYTALATGARQLTVVSHSGIFTMEFEPDFRGGRRYNDKARRMTRRYEQILDAVRSESVDRQGIDPLVRERIVARAREDYDGESPAVIQDAIKQRIEEYKANPELTPEDEEVITELARAKASSDPSRDARDYVAQITNDYMQKKNTRFRLDGVGYMAAMEALQEQFPYYLKKPRAVVVNEKDTINPNIDRGYVEPGRNRPTAARAGLHGTGVNPGKKFSASRADYQGTHAVRRGGTPDGPDVSETPEAAEKEPLPKDKAAAIIQQVKYGDAAANIHRVFTNPSVLHPDDAVRFPLLSMTPEEFRAHANTPDGSREISAMVNELNANRQNFARDNQTEALRALDAYSRAAGGVEAREYEPALGLHWSAQPMQFGAKAYKPGASLEDKQAEVRRINGRTKSVLTGRNLSSLNDTEMRNEVEALAEVYRVVKDNPELQERTKASADARKQIIAGLPSLQGLNKNAVELMLENPKKLERRIEDVHRMRALMADFPAEDRAQFTARDVPVETKTPPTPEFSARRQGDNATAIGNALQHLKDYAERNQLTEESEHGADVWGLIADGNVLLEDSNDVSPDEVSQYMGEVSRVTSEQRHRR